jgi:uncharacterized protein
MRDVRGRCIAPAAEYFFELPQPPQSMRDHAMPCSGSDLRQSLESVTVPDRIERHVKSLAARAPLRYERGMIDPLYSLCGFAVGLLVGMTGVGGGSLMTPLLILLFGVHPATAVGTDLLYAAATKTAGSVAHGLAHSIEWPLVRRLATGSVPASIATLIVLSFFNQSETARSLITVILSFALLITAMTLIFRGTIIRFYRDRFAALDERRTALATTAFGALLGVIVTISSIGAGAVGVCALIILYPRLPMAKIVGSDIAHAVPLTLVAGAGHWVMGTVDWPTVGALLAGSLPGIVVGSYIAVRVSEPALRFLLAVTLIVVSGKLLYDHVADGSLILTAFTRRASH